MRLKLIERGDIWLVNCDPTLGDEIKKVRPAVVINRNLPIGLNLFIIIPITSWNDPLKQLSWITKISKSKKNGLDKDSSANIFQVRSVSNERFIKKIGILEDDILQNIVDSLAFCVGA